MTELTEEATTGEMAGMSQQIAVLLAEREIRAALARYCRGIDRLDEDLVRSAYHNPSYDNHGVYQGDGYAFASWVVPMLRQAYETTMHFLGNSHIEFSDNDGSLAGVETYFIAYHLQVDEAGKRWNHVFAGRYVDRFECWDGEWKIVHRTVVHDWDEVRQVTERFPDEMMETFIPGRRDHEDVSYCK